MKMLSFLLLLLLPYWANAQEQVNKRPQKEYLEEGPRLFAPALGYNTFFPIQYEQTGPFHGPSFGFEFYNQTMEGGDGSPAQLAIFCQFSQLQSLEQSNSRMLLISFGGRFSFETQLSRRFFLPFFGLEFGGLARNDVNWAPQLSPFLGLEIYHGRNWTWELKGSYTNALSADMRQLSGGLLHTHIYINLWEVD